MALTIGDTTAELVPTRAYLLNGVLLVPHYTNKDVYVAPGGTTYDADYIELFQLESVMLLLWLRSW